MSMTLNVFNAILFKEESYATIELFCNLAASSDEGAPVNSDIICMNTPRFTMVNCFIVYFSSM